jgi:hypothetical protein
MPTVLRSDGRGGSVMVYDRCSARGRSCRELLYVDRDGRVYRQGWE